MAEERTAATPYDGRDDEGRDLDGGSDAAGGDFRGADPQELRQVAVAASQEVAPTASAAYRCWQCGTIDPLSHDTLCQRALMEGEAEAIRDAVGDEAVCDRCGLRHGVVWFAPNDLWNEVMRWGERGNPDEFGFCCPLCFMRLAEERLGPMVFKVSQEVYEDA